jgi:hypothetical protein
MVCDCWGLMRSLGLFDWEYFWFLNFFMVDVNYIILFRLILIYMIT